jgi:hypothetical protein
VLVSSYYASLIVISVCAPCACRFQKSSSLPFFPLPPPSPLVYKDTTMNSLRPQLLVSNVKASPKTLQPHNNLTSLFNNSLPLPINFHLQLPYSSPSFIDIFCHIFFSRLCSSVLIARPVYLNPQIKKSRFLFRLNFTPPGTA